MEHIRFYTLRILSVKKHEFYFNFNTWNRIQWFKMVLKSESLPEFRFIQHKSRDICQHIVYSYFESVNSWLCILIHSFIHLFQIDINSGNISNVLDRGSAVKQHQRHPIHPVFNYTIN